MADLSPPGIHAGSDHSNSQPRIRRRNRMITSCLECRRRKLKCDKAHPCANCTKNQRDCVFLAPALDSASQLKLTAIKEQVGTLERQLERDVAAMERQNANDGRLVPLDDEDDFNKPVPLPHDEKDLEPTPLALADAAYEDDVEVDDDVLDLGIQLGRMRMSDRLGGFFRPKLAEELDAALNDLRINNHSQDDGIEHSASEKQSSLGEASSEYVAPSSGFFFGATQYHSTILDFLPSKSAADRLLAQYYLACHPVARIVHKPSFDKRYTLFWNLIALNNEPSGSLQAVIFAMMFNAISSMDESDVFSVFGVAKPELVDNFRLGTEMALSKASFLRSTKIETLQAFVMYLIPMCRDAVSRSHSALTGTAIRIAECMGLHRDGQTYDLTATETHVRRLIWYQLCFLDIRTCEAQGPRPQIRPDSFDTKFPLNLDDEDLGESFSTPKSRGLFTGMTTTLMRFECNEMFRTIWFDRPRIEKKKTSLTAVLAKIEAFMDEMRKKYAYLDERVPLQRYTKLLLSVLHCRMHINVLHRYHTSVSHRIPDRLRQITLTSGTKQLEDSITLDTDPEFHQWAWYLGAYQQWHTAFLLLCELWIYPHRKERDRIWKCLDYVYLCPAHLSRDEKIRMLMTELRNKTLVFQSQRKMRVPTGLSSLVGTVTSNAIANRERDLKVAKSLPLVAPDASQMPTPPPMPGLENKYSGVANGDILMGSAASPDVSGFGNGSNTTASQSRSSASPYSMASPDFNNVNGNPSGVNNVKAEENLSDDLMIDIDWNEWDKLFPPSINDGILNLPDFTLM